MKTSPRETILYLLAFGLALAIRLYHLGALPLTDGEASWALQALGVAQGAKPALGSQTAYILPASLLFFLLGAGTNFLARLFPALVGSALVFVPWIFRERLKPRPSLILSFFLALDPGLLALSRQAEGAILAVTFLLFAWGFWEKRQPHLAGIFAALALMSGPMVWAGLLGLGLVWAIGQGLGARQGTADAAGPGRSEWRTALGSAVGTLVLGGTLFFVSPNGLGAWAGSLQEYLLGWAQPSGTKRGILLMALLVYQPLAVIFGLVATVRGWIFGSRRVMFLSLWALVALLLALFYPGRQVTSLAWVILPLSALAALELAHHLDLHPEGRVEVTGAVALVAFMLIAAWMSLTSIAQNPLDPANTAPFPVTLFGKLSLMLPPRPIVLLLVLFFILIVSVLLVAMGWSVRMARLASVWGAAFALALYSFSAAWGAAGLRMPLTAEMWTAGARPDQADLIRMSADQLSDWTQGNNDALPVTIVGLRSPGLEWLLREHDIELVESLDPSAAPPLVITGQQNDLGLAMPYRGQDFVWTQQPLWDQALSGDWLRWIVFRQMPQNAETVILWARNDLFLDSGATTP